MNVEVKSSAGTSLIPIETRHLSNRRVYLRGPITMEGASKLCDQITYLNDLSTDQVIDLYISSGGGDYTAGLLIYDMITDSACAPIHAHAQGIVASMAAIVFAASTYRDILPNTKLMIHQPLLGRPVEGNATDIQTISENLLMARDQIDQLLAKHSNQDLEEIRQKTMRDTWFTAVEAVNFGLADRVCSYSEMMGFNRR